MLIGIFVKATRKNNNGLLMEDGIEVVEVCLL
jgi:hypothetical protein